MEWKHGVQVGVYYRHETLETSLVEWKLEAPMDLKPAPISLGNFLSGMETGGAQQLRRLGHALGNFLSGMETKFDSLYLTSPKTPWKLP